MTLTEVKIEMDAFNERTANDVELQRSLLSCFEGEFVGVRNSLNTMVLEGNCNAVASSLHKLKGSVGIFGFVKITERISELENMLKTELCADFAEKMSELFVSIEKHIIELKKCIY